MDQPHEIRYGGGKKVGWTWECSCGKGDDIPYADAFDRTFWAKTHLEEEGMDRRKPSKSRKHLAKGRPDFVNMEFEPTASAEQDALEWRDNWISDMKIKHGRAFDIRNVSSTVHAVEDLIGKTVIIELRYTPEGK